MSLADALAPLEAALLDHHRGVHGESLRLRFDDGAVDDVPVEWFFRTEADFDRFDRAAMKRVRGRTLDAGAGAGAHTLALQRRGHAVTALEILPGAVEVLRARGAADVRLESVFDHDPARPYETVLLLMNGTGLVGTLSRLPPLLRAVGRLLAPGGKILVDSTDPGEGDPGDGRHPGELQIQLEYRGVRGAPFPHLYTAPDTLAGAAAEAGLETEVVLESADGRFLATCRPRSNSPRAG